MEIGIGLPSVMPDTPGTLLLHWARKNEELALWAFIRRGRQANIPEAHT